MNGVKKKKTNLPIIGLWSEASLTPLPAGLGDPHWAVSSPWGSRQADAIG